MTAAVEEARALFDAHREALAEARLRDVLTVDPRNADAHALLALCLARGGHRREAQAHAGEATALAPESAWAAYVLAWVLFDDRRARAAAEAIGEALRLAPEFPAYHELQAAILCEQARWAEGLAAAERALGFEPDRWYAGNLRATALRNLRRFDEAEAAVGGVLERHPARASSHAGRGWLLLDRQKAEAALASFREALALDPQDHAARLGMIRALKECHPGYRQLRSGGAFVGIALAVPGVAQLSTIKAHPWLSFGFAVVLTAYVVLLAVTADALLTFALLFNRFGRMSLARVEIACSISVVCCLLLNGLAFLVWLGMPGYGAVYSGILCGVTGALLMGAFALQRQLFRQIAALYILAFILFASSIPIALAQSGRFDFDDPNAALGATFALIAVGWATMSGLVALRRRT